MSSVSASQELDTRLAMALDPFEDMCGPKSQGSIPSWKVRCKLALACRQIQNDQAHQQFLSALMCEQLNRVVNIKQIYAASDMYVTKQTSKYALLVCR